MSKPISAPIDFVRSTLPILSGGDGKYLQTELQAIGRSIASLVLFSPQSATRVPMSLVDGMVRLSRSPWRPLSGQTADQWVYYDAASAFWKAFP